MRRRSSTCCTEPSVTNWTPAGSTPTAIPFACASSRRSPTACCRARSSSPTSSFAERCRTRQGTGSSSSTSPARRRAVSRRQRRGTGQVAAHLEERLSDFGFDATNAADRLAAYHRVENTYLSTFQALGALGLLLGTIGLGAIAIRNVLERRRELALLRAVGYRAGDLRTVVLAENALLLHRGDRVGHRGRAARDRTGADGPRRPPADVVARGTRPRGAGRGARVVGDRGARNGTRVTALVTAFGVTRATCGCRSVAHGLAPCGRNGVRTPMSSGGVRA